MAYHPYTLPVYVYVQLSGQGVSGALPLALLSLSMSVLVIWLVLLIERQGRPFLFFRFNRQGEHRLARQSEEQTGQTG
jgi:ABC-type Fe3+ transport system permease subunit